MNKLVQAVGKNKFKRLFTTLSIYISNRNTCSHKDGLVGNVFLMQLPCYNYKRFFTSFLAFAHKQF